MSSMVRDGRIRTPHRQDWPGILNRLLPAPLWQALSMEVAPSRDGRVRWSPKYIILCWVMIGWSIQRQLTHRFHEGWQVLGRLYYRRRRAGSSYQGLVKASQALGQQLWDRFAECLRDSIPQRLGPRWSWYGWVVMAGDGSRVEAPRTRANQRKLGRSGKAKSHPQWWVTCVIHLPSRVIWDWRQGPGDSSERTHLRAMIPGLPARVLLVADIGFGGFPLLRDLSKAGVCFLIRCASNTTLLVEETRQRIERRGGSQYVYLWPLNRRRQSPLRLRLIVLKSGGQRVYLLTNVMESTRLSRPMSGELYAARWGIEIHYRSLKQTMEHRKLLAKSPKAGAMELAGNIVALILLMLQAFLAMGVRAVRVSVAATLKTIRDLIEALRCCRPTGSLWARLREAVIDEYERHSSKRARDWPYKKREPVPRPPRLRRPTRTERTRIDGVWANPRLGFG